MSYLYLRADENVLAGRTVSSVTGTPDADHPLSWLTDLRPAFPIRYPAGAWKVSVSVASQSVRLAGLANHSLDADVTVGGSISGTLDIVATPPNGVARNPFLLLGSSVVGVTTITFEGTNTQAAIIGEAFAGVPRTLRSFKMVDMHDEFFDGGQELQGDYMNIPAFDEAREWRVYGGSRVYTTSEKDDIISAIQAQRGSSRFTILITDAAKNDARLVIMRLNGQITPADHKDLWNVPLMFIEFPRYRWL